MRMLRTLVCATYASAGEWLEGGVLISSPTAYHSTKQGSPAIIGTGPCKSRQPAQNNLHESVSTTAAGRLAFASRRPGRSGVACLWPEPCTKYDCARPPVHSPTPITPQMSGIGL